jgi:hypothetical protein
MRRSLLTALMLVAVSACQISTEPEVPRVTGRWTGVGIQSAISFWEVLLVLQEDQDGRLSGTAQLMSPSRPTTNLVVRNGAHGHPDVLVSLASANVVDVNYSARMTHPDSLVGLMNGSGFTNMQVTLHRIAP